jgi:adenine C2-methylase RlmN of 23S rRNA A2503 and tRNA A37
MGLLGNLTTGEVVEQLAHAARLARVRNVVFMGMGEPLDNYAAVKARGPSGHGWQSLHSCALLAYG